LKESSASLNFDKGGRNENEGIKKAKTPEREGNAVSPLYSFSKRGEGEPVWNYITELFLQGGKRGENDKVLPGVGNGPGKGKEGLLLRGISR